MLFIYGLLDSSSPNHYSPLCFSPHLAPTRSVTMSPRRGYLGLATMLFTASLVCSGCGDKVHLTNGGAGENCGWDEGRVRPQRCSVYGGSRKQHRDRRLHQLSRRDYRLHKPPSAYSEARPDLDE